MFYQDLGELSPSDKAMLSCAARQNSEDRAISTFSTTNWADHAETHRQTSIVQKMEKFLRYLRKRSRDFGDDVGLDHSHDHVLFDLTNPESLGSLAEEAVNQGLIRYQGLHNAALPFKGWRTLEPTSGSGKPGTAFVAMAFDPSLESAYEDGIRMAIESDCGMTAVRVDRVHHNEKICDRILAEIKSCEFVIADFTLQRGGVYFEAGFALGLGRSVIWMCRDDEISKLHFDTRQYAHILWKVPHDLRLQLADRIRATIGVRQR